jgi:hypothetical protein
MDGCQLARLLCFVSELEIDQGAPQRVVPVQDVCVILRWKRSRVQNYNKAKTEQHVNITMPLPGAYACFNWHRERVHLIDPRTNMVTLNHDFEHEEVRERPDTPEHFTCHIHESAKVYV